jgi:hypothetical protein
MTPARRPKRPYGLGTYVLLIVVIAFVGGIGGAAQGLVGDRPGVLGLVLTAAIMSVTMAIAVVGCVWWWRGIDEAAREAHKWAWWWGGSGGVLIGAIFLLTLTFSDEAATPVDVGVSAPNLIAGGMFAILLFQLAGYSIAWAAWWLRHR